jgi:hypothetical protein
MNERSRPARMGRGLHNETKKVHNGPDHTQTQHGRAAGDGTGKDRHRCLTRDRIDAADLPQLAPKVWDKTCRGNQATDPTRQGERPAEKASGRRRAGEGDALGRPVSAKQWNHPQEEF